MKGKGLKAGGTPGAQEGSDTLADRVAAQFRFPDDVRTKLLSLAPPCDAWKEQNAAIGEVHSDDVAIAMAFEACATRFLRNRIKPAGIPDQREFLQALDVHASALIELLTMFPWMDGTTADFFKFIDKANADRGRTGSDQRAVTYNVLLTLKMFARYRLMNDLAPMPDEARDQKVKRKNTYPRFVLVADLLAAWVRVTGREPMATAKTERQDGVRRVSDAVEFLHVALPPIIKAARQTKGMNLADIDEQAIRKSIAEIKQFWKDGLRPEIAYAIPDWGSRKLGVNFSPV